MTYAEYGAQADAEITALLARIATLEAAVPPVDPPTTDWPAVKAVTIGAKTRTLDVVDGYRDANRLALYTGANPANRYGADVTVLAGKVLQVEDRLTTNGAALNAPTGGVVLSGHGTAREWLLANVTVGATITFSANAVEDPPPVVTPPSGKLFAVWHNRWESAPIRATPPAVLARISQISLGIAQNAGNGAVSYSSNNGQSDADHAVDIRSFVTSGRHVLMGVGGSSDRTTLTSDTHVANFVASFRSFKTRFGITGIDFDLEPSGSSWSVEHAAKALKQLKADGMRVVLTPGLYAEHTAKWGQLVATLGPANYDYMAPMIYDFPETADSRLNAVSVQMVDRCISIGVPVSKVILGYMLRPYAGYSASSPAVMEAAWKHTIAARPGIAGMFLWETGIDQDQGWPIGNGLARIVTGK